MYVVVNSKGEVETEIDSDSRAEVERALAMVYPEHTPIFTTEQDEEVRIENPAELTPEQAMAKSGLPWRPNAKRPGCNSVRDARGVGITMQEVLRAYPLDRPGLERAWEALLEYFPNTPKEFGYEQWGTSASKMARKLLKPNAKLEKAIQGTVRIPPSYAVGLNLLPAYEGVKRSALDTKISEAAYYKRNGAAENPISFGPVPGGPYGEGRGLGAGRRLPLVTKNLDGRGERHSVNLCIGSSRECRATCLAFTGQNTAIAYNDFSKLFMTRALFFQPLAFARMLMEAVGKHVDHCRHGITFQRGEPKVKCDPYVRMNVYADLPFELFFPEFFDYCASVYPDLSLYDYTKVPGRGPLPKPNYDLTFSYSGVNLDECKKALKSGMRVAVVFLRRTAKGSKAPHPVTGKITYVPAEPVNDITFLKRRTPAGVYEGWPVIDGDEHDMRSKDPAPVIVGLRYKIPQKVEIQQRVTLHDGRVLTGKVRGKTGSDLIGIKLEGSGKSVYVDPGEIKGIDKHFVLVPPTAKQKFLVHAKAYKKDGHNQWIMGVTPSQTGADMGSELNANEGELATG
jgi:hypothetical protein